MRVSDAERREVTDALVRHTADGRLTDEEFHERVERALAAKTRADLSGLLIDLPPLAAHPQPPAPAPGSAPVKAVGCRHQARTWLLVLFILLVSLNALHGVSHLAQTAAFWALCILLGPLIVRRRRRPRVL
jgi:hypothetical protein